MYLFIGPWAQRPHHRTRGKNGVYHPRMRLGTLTPTSLYHRKVCTSISIFFCRTNICGGGGGKNGILVALTNNPYSLLLRLDFQRRVFERLDRVNERLDCQERYIQRTLQVLVKLRDSRTHCNDGPASQFEPVTTESEFSELERRLADETEKAAMVSFIMIIFVHVDPGKANMFHIMLYAPSGQVSHCQTLSLLICLC